MSRHIAALQISRFLVAALALYGCGGSELTLPVEPGVPSVITVLRGDDQTGTAGTPLPDSIVVKVTDSQGNPVPNQQVIFVVASDAPGGAVTPGAAMTGQDGTTSVRWILGGRPGTQQVVARVVNGDGEQPLEVRITAAAAVPPANANRLTLSEQPSGSVRVGSTIERQPVVQLRDGQGNPIARAGVRVTAAVASGSGTLQGTTTLPTDESGRAEFTGLRITGGTGPHVLIFAAEGYTSVASDPINVQAAPTTPPAPTPPTPTPPAPTPPAPTPPTPTPPAPTPPAPNQAPVAVNDEYNSVEGYEKTLSVGASEGVLRNDRDPEGGPLTARDASNPPNGRVTLRSDGSFTYNSDPSFFGDDRFTYRVEDAQGKSSTGTVTIHVAPLNDTPRFSHRGNVTVSSNSGAQRIEKWARSISPGADNESDQILTFDVSNDNPGLFTSGGQPAVTRDGPQSKTGTLTFTPSGQRGTANVTVVLRDNAQDGPRSSRPATFRITIR